VPRSRSRGAIIPLPQYAFMAWCSVKKNTGITLHFTLYLLLVTPKEQVSSRDKTVTAYHHD